jgi:hypothetical protein
MGVKTVGKVTLVVAPLVAAAVGCGRVPLDDGVGGSGRHGGIAGNDGTAGKARGAGSGGGSGTPACSGLDEETCNGTPGCQPQSCKLCSGEPTYAGCTTPGAPIECPGEVCIQVPCAGLDEATCNVTPGCTAEVCPAVCGSPATVYCYRAGDTPPQCALPAPCPQPAGPCDMLLDEASCKAHPECNGWSCPDCKGGLRFVACTEPGGFVADCEPCPPSCTGLDEATCKARSDCHPGYCGCPGEQMFTQCLGPSEGVTCGIYSCPAAPASCDLLDEAACGQQPECTPVPCPDCMGGLSFGGCAGPGEGITCTPCPLPLGCSLFGERLCAAVSSCQPLYCPDCMGGRVFVGCDQAGVSATCADGCPSPPPPPPCSSLLGTDCTTRMDCQIVHCPGGSLCAEVDAGAPCNTGA